MTHRQVFYKFMPGTLYNTVTPVMDNLRIRTLYPEKKSFKLII